MTLPVPRFLVRGNRTDVLLEAPHGRLGVTKRLRPFADVAPERRALYREARLQHLARAPGVVPIWGGALELEPTDTAELELPHGERGEYRFLRRPYVPGASLREWLERAQHDKQTRRWLARLTSELLRQLFSVLGHLHELELPEGERGLVHRDVTPDNLLVDDDGELWLNDFGLARFVSEPPLAEDELLQGARGYLPPELARGESPSPASDVFQGALTARALFALAEPRASEHALPGALSAALDPEPHGRPSAREIFDELS